MRQAITGIVLATFTLATWTGCDWGSRSARFDRLPVAVGIAPQAWLVEQVGGDRVSVICLVSSTDDPHTFQPADALISSVLGCRLYFLIGMPYEQSPWFQSLRRSGSLRLVNMLAGVTLRRMGDEEASEEAATEAEVRERHEHHAEGEHRHGGEDPHVWLAPEPLGIMARNVAAALIAADPEGRGYYEENLRRLEERLDQLDAALRGKLGPLRGRAFLVYHPSWGYLADAYGLRQVAAEHEGKPPSDRQLTELARLVRQEGIRVMFCQPQVPATSAQTVARALGTEVRVLNPLAFDVVENLRQTADTLLESYADP